MTNTTDITILLDKSGSMNDRRTATIENLNALIRDQQQLDGECTFTLVQFDSPYNQAISLDYTVEAKPIDQVRTLQAHDYQPRGGTPLLDAIGKVIESLGARLKHLSENDRPAKVVVIILTDGYENTSTRFSKKEIKEMISHQETKYSWSFTFLGAGIDAFAEAGGLGVSIGTTSTVQANQWAYSNAYDVMSQKLTLTRTAAAGVPASSTMSFAVQDTALMNVQSAEEDQQLKAKKP